MMGRREICGRLGSVEVKEESEDRTTTFREQKARCSCKEGAVNCV